MAEESRLTPIDVYFVLLEDSLILDWAGPAEALRMANQLLVEREEAPAFRLHFVGPQTQVRSSVGALVSGVEPLPSLQPIPPGTHWVVLVGQPGSEIVLDSDGARATLHWLRGLRLATGQLELLGVCAGSVIAAHAGLLSGRRATTHHQHLDELRRVDRSCEVLANRVFVQDGPVASSAGVTTGIDLMLHRISAVIGPALTAKVAQTLVVALRRGPQDPELSPFLSHRNHLHPTVHRVQDAVSQSPQDAWTVPRMAEAGCTSPRHLSRLFDEHAGIGPLAYLQRIRLATASTALASGLNVTQAARMAGFSSDTQLRRAWQRFDMPGLPGRHERPQPPA